MKNKASYLQLQTLEVRSRPSRSLRSEGRGLVTQVMSPNKSKLEPSNEGAKCKMCGRFAGHAPNCGIKTKTVSRLMYLIDERRGKRSTALDEFRLAKAADDVRDSVATHVCRALIKLNRRTA